MKRITNVLGKLSQHKRASAVLVLCATAAIALPAQTFTTLHSFDGTDGQYPSGLIQATNGDLYGTTNGGGANLNGTVFKITPSGMLTTLYSFCPKSACADGANPVGGLILATNGDLYGTTNDGGASLYGTVFKITERGALTTLYSFCSQSMCTDGAHPVAGLVQTVNGDLYGTTSSGGANCDPTNCQTGGTVFKITPSDTPTLTTLYSFCSESGCTDGYHPSAGLIQATNGDLYGTTTNGGVPIDGGTVFKITPGGALTTLYSFCSLSGCTDGEEPTARLVQAPNGDLYGTTLFGGAVNPYGGTVFRITPSGTPLTTLHSFCSERCRDGESPEVGLIQAANGDFYGTAVGGGANFDGTIFKITPSGTLTMLYSFCSQTGCTDGELPAAPLVQDTNGTFYGTTFSGGANCAPGGCGTVFSLSVGLGPFVVTQTTSGEVGAVVKILGTGLTGATNVSFNGTAAAFRVSASSLITTTVPAGATSGRVQVVTPSGTLSSNVLFLVRP